MSARRTNLIILLCFLLSGAAGLIYEVLWAKYFSLIFGNTTYAHVLVLATFMGGLALGNFVFGILADKVKSRLGFYAWIEIAISLFCVFTPRLFMLLKDVYLYAAGSFGLNPLGILIIKFIIGAFIMLIPTVLMGGTLPMLSKYMIRSLSVRGETVARLYYINSLGAVLGTLLAGFCLIYYFGLEFSITVAALMNFLAGAIALSLKEFISKAGQELPLEHGGSFSSDEAGDKKGTYAYAIVYLSIFGIFLSGAVAMLYEVVWIRLLSLVLGSSTYSFSLMLAAFISGITIGSFLISRKMPGDRFTFLYFGLSEIGIALSLILSIPFYEKLPFVFLKISKAFVGSPETFIIFETTKFLFCFAIMLPPTIFLGMTLPLVSKIASNRLQLLGRKIGSVFAFNTLGNILGAVISGFILIPAFGLKQTLEIGVMNNLILGSIILWVDRASSKKYKIVLISFCFLVFAGYKILIPEWNKSYFQAQPFRGYGFTEKSTFSDFLKVVRNDKILFYKDGLDATVAVVRYADKGLRLFINGKADASTAATGDMSTQTLCAQLPLILKPGAKDVLIIGLGSGVTCGSALLHGLENLDLVEISSTVVEANKCFSKFNYNALQDKRLHLYIEDAKTFINRTKRKYDLIINEPSNPWISGIGNLFSVEYFNDCLQRLKEDGLMVQWLQAYEIDDDTFRTVLRTFHSVFPELTIWNSEHGDTIIIGSRKKMTPDFNLSEKIINLKQVKDDLSRIELRDLFTLLSLQLSSSGNDNPALEKDGLLNSDYYPVLEYKAPLALYTHSTAVKSLTKLDERKFPINKTSLLLAGYLKNHKIDDKNLRNLFIYFNKNINLYKETILRSLARKWFNEYPRDDEANLVYASYNIESLEKGTQLLEKLIKKSNKFEYLKKYANLQADRYILTRSFLTPEVFNESVDKLKMCLNLSEDRKAHFYYLLGKIHFENRDYRKSLGYYLESEKSIKSGEDAEFQEINYGQFLEDAGLAHFANGDFNKGFEYIRKARSLDK